MKTFLQDPSTLGSSLVEVNRQIEETQAQKRAAILGVPYVDLEKFPLNLQTLALIPEETALAGECLVFFKEGKDLRVALIDPENQTAKQEVERLSKQYTVKTYLISKSSFKQTAKFYSKVITPKAAIEEVVRVNSDFNTTDALKNLESQDWQLKQNVSDLINNIFGIAVNLGSSDIHFEPEEGFVKIRYRVDGALHDKVHFAKSLQTPLNNRLKILSRLKLNVSNQAQDGRLSFFYGKNPIDVRVSSLPSAYGEAFVFRLLGTGATQLKMNQLGFQDDVLKKITAQIRKPNGMLLTTGPTGSGKTTTLYSFLNELNETGVKIITLEDPVEYKLEGIQQTPIDHNVNFDFAQGLRAILRQDPDIVMVGEIRDLETAETAAQASLTGHIVFSTLHTNDASGAIPRLLNMGVAAFVLSPALLGIIAQRLVRKMCQDCKTQTPVSPDVLTLIKKHVDTLPTIYKSALTENLIFFTGKGCQSCNGLGFKGRLGVYEFLEKTEKIEKLIFQNASTAEIQAAAMSEGMLTIIQDGILKALNGITTLEEVLRVVGA